MAQIAVKPGSPKLFLCRIQAVLLAEEKDSRWIHLWNAELDSIHYLDWWVFNISMCVFFWFSKSQGCSVLFDQQTPFLKIEQLSYSLGNTALT